MNGQRTGDQRAFEDEDGNIPSFADAEKAFYEERYRGFIEGQNARNAKSRHTDRNRTANDILHDKRFCPEETIYQFGKEGGGATPEQLMAIVTEFHGEFERRYGEHVHIIDWAMHVDETTPHIQERHCFDYTNKYGEIEPKQERSLEQLGIPLPHPDQKQGRFNSRKMTFDAACRDLLIEIAKQHGLEIEEVVRYGGKTHRDKVDLILESQQEKLDEQAQRIAENEAKIAEQLVQLNDGEAILNKATEIAYSQAVSIVTEKVVDETQKADAAVLENIRQKALAPKSKASSEMKRWIDQCVSVAVSRFQKGTSKIKSAIKRLLMKPEVKQEAQHQIKEASRESILENLRVGQQTSSHPKKDHTTNDLDR